MSLRRKVYVLNAPEDTRANLVSASATGSPFEAIVDGSPRELICSWIAKGFTYKVIDAVAETAQVVSIAIGTVVVGAKYILERECNPMYLSGRDANGLRNTKRYTFVPSVTTKQVFIDAFVALVNADVDNYAVATNSADTSLVITEDGGYGLVAANPGPAFWRLITTSATVLTHTSTPAVVPVGNGAVMLANKAVWTKDGKWIREGLECYNFDNTLPVSTKTYSTFIISAKYAMSDHDLTTPDLTDELILYVDDVNSNYLGDLKTALTADVVANA